MKFDMGTTTLSTLHTRTAGSGDDLTALVRQLIVAADPLEGRFSGQGRQAFDAFKGRTDQICADLDASLTAIVGVQAGMDATFTAGDEQFRANAAASSSGATFDGAPFSRTAAS